MAKPAAVVASSWSDLPQELLCLIFNRLKYCVDFIRCATVCPAWRTLILESYRDFIPQLPLILLLPRNYQKEDDLRMLDITTKKIHTVHVPETRGRCICNAMINGWLLTVDLNWPHKTYLLNPFSRAQVLLPPLEIQQVMDDGESNFDVECNIRRAIITTANPRHPDCLVLIIHSIRHKLAYCKPGDEKWTYLVERDTPLHDIAFYNGKFYAIDESGCFLQLELIGQHGEEVWTRHPLHFYDSLRYWVKSSSGDLLLVLKYRIWNKTLLDDDNRPISFMYTDKFEVVKLELNKGERIVTDVKSLGDDEVLFVSFSCAISVSSSKTKACRGNCIYFLDLNFKNYMGLGMGVFDLRTQRVELLYPFSLYPFHWITP